MLKRFVLLGLLLVALLAACEPGPSAQYKIGDNLLTEHFDSPDAWENFTGADYSFQVQDSVYHVTNGPGGYVWGLNQTTHTDVVIEAQSKQLSDYKDNFYGVICRASTDNNGQGYYFLISGDGYGAISYGHDDKIDPIVGPKQTSAINQGQGTNVIRAVCVGDYLALYVNGNFVLDARDSHYTSGYAGLSAAVNADSDTSTTESVEVTFDDLTISAATLAQ